MEIIENGNGVLLKRLDLRREARTYAIETIEITDFATLNRTFFSFMDLVEFEDIDGARKTLKNRYGKNGTIEFPKKLNKIIFGR